MPVAQDAYQSSAGQTQVLVDPGSYHGSLPFTGADVQPLGAMGLCLIVAGLAMRRLTTTKGA